ncbi:hypothetical protein SARC_13440, partial [Sphaeroforma arctica JP610]
NGGWSHTFADENEQQSRGERRHDIFRNWEERGGSEYSDEDYLDSEQDEGSDSDSRHGGYSFPYW